MAKVEMSSIKLELSGRELYLITHALRYMSTEALYDFSKDDQDAEALLKELASGG